MLGRAGKFASTYFLTQELGEWGPERRGSRFAETDKGGGPFGERYKAKSQKLDPPAGVLLPSCYGQGQRQLGAQLARPGGRRCAAPGSGLQLWVSPARPAPSLIRKLRREEGGNPRFRKRKGEESASWKSQVGNPGWLEGPELPVLPL